MNLLNVVGRYLFRISEDKAEKNLRRLLLLLSDQGSVKDASEDDRDTTEVDERVSPSDIKKEFDRKRGEASKINRAFYEAVHPYIHDQENLKKYTDGFFNSVYANLKKKTSYIKAVEFIDEATEHIIEHIDTFVRHGHGDKAYITRESAGIVKGIRSNDPNFEAFKEDTRFFGTIISESSSIPFMYTIKLSGSDIVDPNETYRMDCSKSILELNKGDKYRMVITSLGSVTGNMRDINFKVEGASKGTTHYRILSEQLPSLIFAGVKDFISGAYKKLVTEDEQAASKKMGLLHQMELLEAEIEDKESKGVDTSSLQDRLKKINRDYSELEVGLGEDVPWKSDDREEPKHKEEKEKYVEHDPHVRWYGVKFSPELEHKRHPYTSPGMGETQFTVTDDDIRKIRHDIMSAVEGESFSKPGITIPYSHVFDLLYDSAFSVADPSKEGFKNKFIDHILSYAKKHNMEKLSVLDHKQLERYANEMIKEFQDKILKEDKFKHLRDNLRRALVRRMKLSNETSEDVKNLNVLWHNPSSNIEKLSEIYHRLSMEIEFDVFKKDLRKLTEEGYRNLLDKDMDGSLKVLHEISDALYKLDRHFLDRLRGFFLAKLLDMTDLNKKVDLYRIYREDFGKDTSGDNLDLRKDLMDDIRTRALEWTGRPERMDVKVKERKYKKTPESEVMEIIRKRDPELMKRLDKLTDLF